MARTLREMMLAGEVAAAPSAPSGGPSLRQMVEAGEVTPEAQPEVGGLEHFANRWSTTLPLGRPVRNLLGTALVQALKLGGAGRPNVQFTPEAQAQAEAMGLPGTSTDSVIPGMLDTYRQIRDRSDLRLDAGTEQHPTVDKLATGAGIASSIALPMPKFLGGMGFGRQALQAARTGGPQGLGQLMSVGARMGALQSAGDSRADLTSGDWRDYAQQVAETGLGAGVGALGAPIGFAVGKLAAPVLRGTGNLLRRGGLKLGEKVLLPGGANSMANKKALKPEVVEEAIRSGAIVPFGTTEGTLGRLNRLTEHQGEIYNDIVRGLELRGVRGPKKTELADILFERAVQMEPNEMNAALPNMYLDAAETVLGKMTPGAEPTLGLSQAETLKRAIMEDAKYGAITETRKNKALREIGSIFRQANEDAIEAQAARSTDPEVIDRAESFVPVKQRLGRLLSAEEAAEKGAARASQKSTVGLKDMMAGAALGGGTAAGGGAAIVASKVANARLPAAGATGLYWGGQAAGDLADLARQGIRSGTLPASTARALSAAERARLGDWLAGQEATPEAMAEALRRRRR